VVTRWWGVALLALSVGLNAGLGVAVLQQRFLSSREAPGRAEAPPAAQASVEGPATQGAVGSGSPAPAGGGNAAAGSVEPVPAQAPAAAEPEAETETAVGPELAWAAPRERDEPRAAPRVDPPRQAAAVEPREPPPGQPFDRLPPGGPPEARLAEMAERLGVPPADRPRFAALQRRFFTETREQRGRLGAVRRQLKDELTAPEPDRQRIGGLLVQSGELQAGLERSLVEHVLAAREVLDGEAERRYLHFLSRLGVAGPGGPVGGPGPRGGVRPRGRDLGAGPGLRPQGLRPQRRRGAWPPPRGAAPVPSAPVPPAPVPAPAEPQAAPEPTRAPY
jgi:hypothetical protein